MMISSIFCILTDAFILFALMGYLMIREEAFEENLKFLEERYADTDTAPLIGPPPPDDRRGIKLIFQISVLFKSKNKIASVKKNYVNVVVRLLKNNCWFKIVYDSVYKIEN